MNSHTCIPGHPPVFRNDEDAARWAVGVGAYAEFGSASAALAELRKALEGAG